MNHHPVRSVFNLIADLLTLLAVALAGVGHMLPWTYVRHMPHRFEFGVDGFRGRDNGQIAERQKREQEARAKAEEERQARQNRLTEFQIWHAMRSGIALGALAILVGLSLAVNWSWTARRWLSLLMFACAVTALLFQVMMHSPYHITEAHRELASTFREGDGFIMSVTATGFALFFCLARMVWTMPRTSSRVVPVLKPADENDELGEYPEPGDYYAQHDPNAIIDKEKKDEG